MPTGVVEHAVDDDAQAHAVRLVHQRAELRVRAHAGIDVEVVQQVVFVIGIGGEHGVEIDAVAPQIAYIAEVEAHALHRAAQPRGAHFPVPGLLRPLAANGRPPGGEAVREDVVHHGVRRPRGHFQPVGAVVVGKLEALVALPRQLALEAVSVVVPDAVLRLQFKAVAHARQLRAQFRLVPVAVGVGAHAHHGQADKGHARVERGTVGAVERAALEHAVRGAQAEHEAPFLHGVGELTAGAVVNGGKFHKHYPFTEPEVTPDT